MGCVVFHAMKLLDKVFAVRGKITIMGEIHSMTNRTVTILDRRTCSSHTFRKTSVSKMPPRKVASYESDIPMWYLVQESDKRKLEVQSTWNNPDTHSASRMNRKTKGTHGKEDQP